MLDSPKPKEFADDNFKFHENGSKFYKRVKYAMEKGEIARYEQFSFPTVFPKVLYCRNLKTCLGKGKSRFYNGRAHF